MIPRIITSLVITFCLSFYLVAQSPADHYAPYPGHASEGDFKTLVADPIIFLENDLDNPYKKGKAFK